MTTGTLKWFNDDTGFGFVTADNGREELFAHHSEINMSGLKLLKKGQKIDFEVTQIPGGKQASHFGFLHKRQFWAIPCVIKTLLAFFEHGKI